MGSRMSKHIDKVDKSNPLDSGCASYATLYPVDNVITSHIRKKCMLSFEPRDPNL